ncbi:hypothetical protein Clacol_004146 [Clathrus columnatus]|uniref:PB1 domain-containing protein n=1 Tax=Clathrus columnatus TaxID=1419009 RepID=A0AAV5A8C8_9AGAM|nr:hypothetical protein Clacol_004146 [Clathrus columnatus]
MSPIQFKFLEREGTVRVASFPEPPTWKVLSERIEHLYSIPAADVGISYFDNDGYVDYNKSYELRKVTQKNRDEITINTNDELQAYYTTIPPVHNAPLKFVVKNIRSNQRRRPPTDILVDLDDTWTPIFSAVPLTPSRMRDSEARIEEIVDSEDEKSQNKAGRNGHDVLDIPHEDDEDDDDASSIDSIFENDLPNKKPIHVNRYSREFQKEPSFRSVSRSSSKTAESRSMSSTEEDPKTESPVILPVPGQPKIPSARNSGYEFAYNNPPAQSHLAHPVQDRPRSRSRSPAPQSPFVTAREIPMDRSSRRSSRTVSERPSPIIPTIETASPRGFPPSVDMNSIPSPEPIIVPVPTIPEESLLLEENSMPDPPLPIIPSRGGPGTAANSTTTPSLTNDIASLLDALTQAFNEHPELSEGLRNIVRNASQGVYWNNATDAIQNVRNSVVNDALEARHVILNRPTERDVSGRAQAEAGRKIAEALGNVFRSLGTILGSDSSFPPTSASESRSAAPSVPTPAHVPAPAAPETLAAPHVQGQRGEDDFLPNPRAGSPAPIKATPLIRGQDFPSSDAQSLSRSSSRTPSPANDPDSNAYPDDGARVSSHRSRKIAYPAPQYVPLVWGPPPKGRSGDRNPYAPPVPVVVSPYGYSRNRHHRSHSGTGGSAYPPPSGPPPPSGQYYMSPYPTPPYAYPRYPPPPPDPRMYPGAGEYDREYGRDGYPGIGSGGNVRRSNTLPPHFSSPLTPVSPGMIQPTAPSEIPRASQPSPRPSSIDTAPIIPPVAPPPAPVIIAPSQSSVPASNPETPQSSAVVVSSPASTNDKFAELEEAKRIYKEKKEEWRQEREERRIQREKERAERQARRQGRLPAPPGSGSAAPAPVPPPRPLAINSPGFLPPPASSNAHRNESDDDSGTERAFPPAQQDVTGPVPPTSPLSSQRLHEEVFERLNAMGFTIRSYPQLSTLVPMNIRKHTLMNKGQVPDEVVVQQVLDDIFTAPIANKI